MTRATPFTKKALGGYAALTVLLAGGMALSIVRLGTEATARVSDIRRHEQDITVAERLRWHGELIVSNGRGYLLTEDPYLLARLHDAERSFARDVGELKASGESPEASALVEEAEKTAARYRQVLSELISAGNNPETRSSVVHRFEAELLPARGRFGEALDRLVDSEVRALQRFYQQAADDQALLTTHMLGMVALLVAVGVGIAWFFARLLARSFDNERLALESSQRAVAARDELMGMVAHDLRNPLLAITMKAALLERLAASDKARAHAEAIGQVATRMELLIKSMLDVATIEAGRFSVLTAPCDPAALLGEATEMFRDLAAAKGVVLEHVERKAPEVSADRERILQVLSNLLGNALKFTPEGGKVTVAVSPEGPVVRFSVSDTGPGIAREHLPRLFERFWKHETGGKKGTGLGLFISHGIIAAHGGSLSAESEVGRGASFTFTLPTASRDDGSSTG